MLWNIGLVAVFGMVLGINFGVNAQAQGLESLTCCNKRQSPCILRSALSKF